MTRTALSLLLLLSPLMATAATPWAKWHDAYVRLEDDGNISCARWEDSKHCNWNSAVTPPANVRPLVCGAEHKKEWGITGYDHPRHWCNNAYADLYAKWALGNSFGFNVFLSQNPAGELMCDSVDGVNCRWFQPDTATGPSKPIVPLSCGPAGASIWGPETYGPDHWCQQARGLVDERDYSDPKWDKEVFRYHQGWAGTGFGLTGTQRGAPESMTIGEKDGRKGLAIMSLERDAAWYQLPQHAPSIANSIYGRPDAERQDDLYMYGKSWTAADEPMVAMHVYVPQGNTTSLRMPVFSMNSAGEERKYPGIWVTSTSVRVRTVIGEYTVNVPTGKPEGSWWTLGMKVTATGDIEFYGVPEWRASPFHASTLLARQSALLGTDAHKVLRQIDATVMVSSIMYSKEPIIIGDIRYGIKTKAQQTTP